MKNKWLKNVLKITNNKIKKYNSYNKNNNYNYNKSKINYNNKKYRK